MKKRLIDYDKLYHAVMDAALSSTDEDMIFDLMDRSTVDAVPVVRCRECTHYNGHWNCDYFCEAVLDDDFCSYGERRTENGK